MTDPNRRSGRRKPDSNASLPHLGWFLYAARFTFAHLALCAAAIRLRPAAEIVRFGFAHRAFCVKLISSDQYENKLPGETCWSR